MSKYSSVIDLANENSPHTKVIHLIGREQQVLEFGCATGHMSKVLKEEFGCEVTGLEINKEDAEKAKQHCAEVITGDVETLEWLEKLDGKTYDAAIFADILEHLKDPKAMLQHVKHVLKEDGFIVIAVPNIANISIRLELLLGGFEYEDLGILDNSHLKYFTAKTIIQMVEDAGLYIQYMDYVVKDIPERMIRDALEVIELIPTQHTIDFFNQVDALAFEYIIKAVIKKPEGYSPYRLDAVKKPERIMEDLIREHLYQMDLSGKQLKDQDEFIKAQASEIQNQIEEILAKNETIQNQIEKIGSMAVMIRDQDRHIRSIESELDLIKQSKVWKIAEWLRITVYQKLFGKFPLIQKGMMTLSRSGFRHFIKRTIAYSKRNKDRFSLGYMDSDYARWIKKNELTPERRRIIKKEIESFALKPKISIIMPVYNVDRIWLQKAVDSVLNQLYENWELCICDDASTKKHVRQVLERYEKEERIRIKYSGMNRGISGASNEALSLATGEYIGLLDNDDELSKDALYESVKRINLYPDADMIYSDEDKIDTRGNRLEPFFKPDYSPDFLLSNNYICHFSVFRKSIIDGIGGFRIGYEGSQDYDLTLRFIERTHPEKIHHIPKILYHWRKVEGSAAAVANAKDYAFTAGRKALSDYLERNGIAGKVVDGNFLGAYRVIPDLKSSPAVSIIIPFKDRSEILKRCVDSIIEKTTYKTYELVLINNGSKEAETSEYLKELKSTPVCRILDFDYPFNFSAINNFAVSKTDNEHLIFLNNDTEVISPDWIESMIDFAQRKDVGAVGALLYYPDNTIQHGGVTVGVGGVASHAHKHFRREDYGYFGRLKNIHNVSAVTAACLMTKKTVFEEVGGFDERFSHAFNDVDFCLKIRKKGYLIVYTPYAELYHHESLSRGLEDTPEKQKRFVNEIILFQESWGTELKKGDPYYNPNLTLDKDDFSIRI